MKILQKFKEKLEKNNYYRADDLMVDVFGYDDWELVKTITYEPERWTYEKEKIFKVDNTYISIRARKANTEMQMNSPIHPYNIKLVKPKEVTVTKYIPIKEGTKNV